jgi:hypothetical protein
VREWKVFGDEKCRVSSGRRGIESFKPSVELLIEPGGEEILPGLEIA